jgi:P pilus assembly chaperone PapD
MTRVSALLATFVTLAISSTSLLRAQAILVAPQSVVLESRARSGVVELFNPGSRPAEVSLSAVFGHPVTTDSGDLTLRIIEHPDSTMPSAAGFIEAFPRRLVLQPNQRQTVRLLARPPQGLPDGEYWARLVVASKDAAPAAEATPTPDAGGVQVGLSLEVRTIIAVNYRQGAQRTGVALGTLTTSVQGDSVVIRAPMERVGTSAWIGMSTVKLLNASGATVAAQAMQTAVYTRIAPRFAFDRSALPTGQYRVVVELSTDRPDVTQATLLRAPPQRGEVLVSLGTP